MDNPGGKVHDKWTVLAGTLAHKRMALDHPAAKDKIDPAFKAAMLHPKVDWVHYGRYGKE